MVKVLIYIEMLFFFSTPVLIRHLWQLKTVVCMHMCCSIKYLRMCTYAESFAAKHLKLNVVMQGVVRPSVVAPRRGILFYLKI